MSTARIERRLTAILAADVAGYSRLMGEDEEGILVQLNEHRRALVDPKLSEYRGRLVKTTGDGMLVEFPSVVDAVRCAVDIQRGMAERNLPLPLAKRIEFRIGINVGDIILDGGDIFGDGVNVAARLEGLAEPNGICVSSRVQEDAQGKLDIAFEDMGEQRLKNIVRPVRAFRVRFDKAEPDARAGWLSSFYPVLGVILLLLSGALLWTELRSERSFFATLISGARSARTPELGSKPALAILPFVNQGGDVARDYFADGLTQDLISALGRFSALTVMSWNAVAPYKAKPATPGEIGRALGVRYQVEGSVRQMSDRVRVATQLVQKDGRVLWSAGFDEALADVFALQDKITSQIAGALAIGVAEIEQRRVFAKPTDNLEAYDYVLRARPALQRPTRSNIVEARTLLRRAIQLDVEYAAAYAALAETYLIGTVMGWAQSPAAFLNQAEELATKALNLNDSEVRGRIVLGRVHIFHQRYEQARAELDRAVATNPNDADGLAGRGNIFMWLGQTDMSIETLEQAQRINPELNPLDRNALGLAYYLNGHYEHAVEQAKLNLGEVMGAHFSHALLAAAYAQQGRPEAAADAAATVRRVDPTFDPHGFGSKLRNPSDLERLRDGLRKAGLYPRLSPDQR